MRLLFVASSSALLFVTQASAQTTPSPAQANASLATYLDKQFIGVVSECAGIKKFANGRFNSKPVSAIPATLQTALLNDLPLAYQELDGRTLTDLFSAIWTTGDQSSDVLAGHERLPLGLGLRFTSTDDRVVYGEANSTRHTHNCSTVVGLALTAGAKIGGEELATALKASYDNTSSLNLSLVTGTFRSPVWAALTVAPGGEPSSPANRFAANAALWQWYFANPARAKPDEQYFLLDQLEGLALYRFTGLTWATKTSGNAAAGGNLGVVSASASARGQLEISGSTNTNNFTVLRFSRSTPVFQILPSVAAASLRMSELATFEPVGDWPETAVVTTSPVRLVYDIELPSALCRDGWTSNDAVTSLTVATAPGTTSQAAQKCRFTATFTPSSTAAATGAIPVQYEATLAFPKAGTASIAGGDLKLLVGKGRTLADYRARISVLPYERSLTVSGTVVAGRLQYRLSTTPGTTVSSFTSNPTIYVSCEGEAPKLAVAQASLVTPGDSKPLEVHLQISDARTAERSKLAMSGGSCQVSGSVQAVVAGVGTPVTVDLGAQMIAVAALPPAPGVPRFDLEKSSLRFTANSQ